MSERSFEILLVEDNPADVELTRIALRRCDVGRDTNLRVVECGEDALALVRREGEYAEAARPDLILLDIQLPGKDGVQVLREIKEDDELRLIPVIVMSSSDFEDDVRRCYEYRANSYIRKAADMPGLEKIMTSVVGFWLASLTPPPS